MLSSPVSTAKKTAGQGETELNKSVRSLSRFSDNFSVSRSGRSSGCCHALRDQTRFPKAGKIPGRAGEAL